MNIAELEISARVYDHLYEETPITIGKESVLTHFGLMIKNCDVNLQNLVDHFKSAKEHGLTKNPTWVIKFDTKANNALDYYTGVVAVSKDLEGFPQFRCYVFNSALERVYNEVISDWVEGTKLSSMALSLTVKDGASKIEVKGDGFDPSEFSNNDLTTTMAETITAIRDFAAKAPVFQEVVDEVNYREGVLQKLVDTTAFEKPAFWNLAAWDIGINDGFIGANYL